MSELNLKPAKGRRVRKPNLEPLQENGERVTDSPYWQRRLADGDVEITTLPKPKKQRD